MGFKEISSNAIEVGRNTSQILLRKIRDNFSTHESRISDIETNLTTVPTGLIFKFAGSSAPNGFLVCNGAEALRAAFPDLFAIVGTAFGTPSGGTVFKLPDFRGRIAVGSGNLYSVGDADGEEEHVLTESEHPSHSHTFSETAHYHEGVYINFGGLSFSHRLAPGTKVDVGAERLFTDDGTTGITLGNTGSDAAHNNMQPSNVKTYIIKT